MAPAMGSRAPPSPPSPSRAQAGEGDERGKRAVIPRLATWATGRRPSGAEAGRRPRAATAAVPVAPGLRPAVRAVRAAASRPHSKCAARIERGDASLPGRRDKPWRKAVGPPALPPSGNKYPLRHSRGLYDAGPSKGAKRPLTRPCPSATLSPRAEHVRHPWLDNGAMPFRIAVLLPPRRGEN